MASKLLKGLLGAVFIGVTIATGGAAGAFGFAAGAKGLLIARGLLSTAGMGLLSAALKKPMSDRNKQRLANPATADAPLPVVYGTERLGIRIVDARVNPGNRSMLYVVGAIALGSEGGDGIEAVTKVYLDERLAIDGPDCTGVFGIDGVQEPFVDVLDYAIHLGTDAQTVDAELTARFPTAWPSTSAGAGIAYIVLRLQWDEDVFPGSIPQITMDVKGQKVLDPRDDSTAWSNNPALCVLDFLQSRKYGCLVADTEVDSQSFEDAADFAEEMVEWSVGFEIQRFTCDGAVPTEQARADNLRELLTSCRGHVVYQSGTFRLVIRDVATPTTFALTEHNIIGDWEFIRAGATVPNLITASFINSSFQVDEVTWPKAGAANGFLAADNGFPVPVTIDLPYTRDLYRATQVAMVQLEEARADLSVMLTATDEALKCQVGDLVPLTHSTPGFTAKPLWVEAMAIATNGTVRLVLREYDESAYDLDELDTHDDPPGADLPDAYSCAPPTALVLTSDDTTALATQDGQFVPRILVEWTPADEPFLAGYEIEYRVTGDTEWTPAPNARKDAIQTLLAPVTNEEDYDVRIRAFNALGVHSVWLEGSVTVSTQAGTIGSRVPGISFEPSQSGSVGVFDLVVTDPDLLALEPEFAKAIGAEGTLSAWDDTWDADTGVAGTDEELLRTEGVEIDPDHNSRIMVRVPYVIDAVTYYTDPVGWTYDIDTEARIVDFDVGVDGGPSVVVTGIEGDEDTVRSIITVTTNGDDPADPTDMANDGELLTRTGDIDTAIAVAAGETIKVKIRGLNADDVPGPVRQKQYTYPGSTGIVVEYFQATKDENECGDGDSTNTIAWKILYAPAGATVSVNEIKDDDWAGKTLKVDEVSGMDASFGPYNLGFSQSALPSGLQHTFVFELIIKDAGGNIIYTPQLSNMVIHQYTEEC